MTVVLLLEQAPGQSERLLAQLRGLHTRTDLQVQPLGGATPAARTQVAKLLCRFEQAIDSGQAVAVITPVLDVPDQVLLRVLDDPGLRLGALVADRSGAHGAATQGAMVLSAATDLHPVPDADADSLGLVYLDAASLPPAVQALRGALADAGGSWDALDVPDLVLAILTRARSLPPVRAVRLEPFSGSRGPAGAGAADDPAPDLAARTAARPGDGFYSTFVLRRISARLTPWAIARGIAANTVTSVSAVIGVAGAVSFAFGSYPALIVGALLLQLSILLDCVDGEIARATRTGSAFGGWLDAATDRVKEYGALAGLALAGHHLWTLAAAAMVVQTVRHMRDFAFDKGVIAEWRTGFRDVRPMSDTTPWLRPTGSAAGPERLTGSAGMWARRLIRMPIGERWLVLCVAALADRPWLGLTAYLALTLLAEVWALLGALRRTVDGVRHYTTGLRATLADYRDDGLLELISRRRSPDGLAAWLLPPLVTAAEGAAVIALTAAHAQHWTAAAFGWFALVAWHRYDIVYRRAGHAPSVPVAVGYLGGGWLVRVAALLVAAIFGGLPAMLVAGSAWLAVVYIPESLWTGLSTMSRKPRRAAA